MSQRLLLVEDDDAARQSLTRTLTRGGFTILQAASTKEAMAHISGATPLQMVVTDVVLGGEERGGIEVLRAVKARHPAVPVILITAFAAVENVKAGLNEGAAFLLEKPFRAQELLDVIARLTSHQHERVSGVDQTLGAAGLTDKELSIARLLLKGLTSAEIARLEGNSEKTVRQHITRIYAKCGVTSRPEFFHHVFPW